MYEQFYGLAERPFQILPDPSYLFLSKGHSTALTLLRYSLQSGQGFTVITGEVGCGKTTLINHLLDEVRGQITVGLINFTTGRFEDLAEWIMMAYGLDYKAKSKAEHYDEFVKFLIGEYSAGRQVVLIVDEAQNMGVQGLEELRMLSNVNAQKDYLLHLVLVGQPELRSLLKKRELRQLTQRVSVAFHLERLTADEVREYIRHRIKIAGGREDLFTDGAIYLISAASNGIPRLVNTFCELALVYGFADSRNQIEPDVVKAVVKDRKEMGLPVAALGERLAKRASK
ncbi:MAG: AAA family ATPase [Chromatiales bacterium]|nr:AAA family ATPase [Chromatiales bacterium]